MTAALGGAQLRAWAEEVARDPGSLAFLPLAEVYRREGRRDAAVRLCLRGLERHPDHVDAHFLLGLLYREGGEAVKAFDEWDIALRLDPLHAPARRHIGFLSAEREEWTAAVRHLTAASQAAPEDAALRTALEAVRVRAAAAAPAAALGAPQAPVVDPPAPAGDAVLPQMPPAAPEAAAAPPPEPSPPDPPPPEALPSPAPVLSVWETAQAEFRTLAVERGVMGALLLDEQGLVVAGELHVDSRERGAEVAAALRGASTDAERALRHLGLGDWTGILLETPETVVRIMPVSGSMLAVAARREVPTGWVVRVAERAHGIAVRLIGADGDAS
ncbi:MAG: roadblock/LC7 domain-containing protein [Gemmatimonadota bacterium]|nr:roadblock/LC7 domain-containing protein [Gemmatimonadota bacterium]